MATADQSAALQNALARAKEIAAKLQQQGAGSSSTPADDDSRKRSLDQNSFSGSEPYSKKAATDDPNNPKALAMQVAQTLVGRAGLGSMFQEEINVPNKIVGLIIGRGGEMINKLQVKTNARIQIAPDPPPERAHEDRQLTLTGTPEAVGNAKNIIERIVSEGKVPDSLNLTQGLSEYSCELMIPSPKVGLVIGKGGETIRSLQERANCKMVLIQDGIYQNQDEKPLRITGDREKCEFAKTMVVDLLNQKELETSHKSSGFQQGAITTHHDVPRESVGFVIGKGGETIRKIMEQSQCNVQFKTRPGEDDGGPTKAAVLTGTQEQIDAAKAIIDDIVENGNKPKGERNMSGPGEGMGDGGGLGGPRGKFQPRPSRMPQTPLQPGEKMMDIKVDRKKCGLVIGKGGITIQQISQDCGPNFFIEMNTTVPEEAPFRVFSMRGYEEKLRQAESIIREKVGDPTCCAYEVSSGPQPDNSNQFGGGPPGNQWQGGPQQGGGPWGGPQQPWQQNQNQPPWQQQPQQPWNQQGQGNPPWQQHQQAPWQQQQGQMQAGQQSWQQGQTQQGGQWGAQQPAQTQQPAQQTPASASQTAATPATGADGQPDYTAAWAQYYQNYYAQFGQPAPGAPASATPSATSATTTQSSGATQQTNTGTQGTGDYSKEWQEYYAATYPGYTAPTQPTS